MDNVKGSLKALENWAKKATIGYKDVCVRDMSKSFRDGLAFCAIIHHYRPDLIDFDSLQKENIYDNNYLAFSTAEKKLGVPALLDAEDMEKYATPDRLCIITYLSQLRNYFENQNRVNTMKPTIKRMSVSEKDGPPVKVPFVDSKLLPLKRHEVCQKCKHRVFILERLIVDSKLYHRTCFTCSKCEAILNPGAYIEGDDAGSYECSTCLQDEKEYASPGTPDESCSDVSGASTPYPPSSPALSHTSDIDVKQSLVTATVANARNNFLQKSLDDKKTNASDFFSPLNQKESVVPSSGISVKAKISAFESNKTHSSVLPLVLKTNDVSRSDRIGSEAISANSVENNLNTVKNDFGASEKSSDFVGNYLGATEKRSNSIGNHLGATEKYRDSVENKLGATDKHSDKVTTSPDHTHADGSIENVNSGVQNDELSTSQSSTFESTSTISTLKFPKEESEPAKSATDIFRTNIKPLRFSTSLNECKNVTSPKLTLPVIKSADHLKNFSSFNIPYVKPTYTTSLPRPSSYSNLLSKGNSLEEDVPEKSLSDIFHDRWSKTNVRRSSLESNLKRVSSVEKEVVPHEQDKEITTDGIQNQSTSPVDVNDGKNISNDDKEKPEPEQQGLVTSFLRMRAELRDGSESKFTPVPIPRSSLGKNDPKLVVEENVKLHVETEDNNSIPEAERDLSKIVPKEDTVMKIPEIEVVDESKTYPGDLNPFGDDEVEEYPDDLNPFGDDEDEYDEAKNPFASDDEADESMPRRSPNILECSPFSTYSGGSSPSGSFRGTTKKRRAPQPPKMSEIFPHDATESQSDVSFNSLQASPSPGVRKLPPPSPKARKSKPAPPPPKPPSQIASVNDVKDVRDDLKPKTPSVDGETGKQQWKKKKRPAPSVPIPQRKEVKKIPLKDILLEMKGIEEKQKEYEKQGRELELLIRDKDKDEEPTIEEEEYIMQLFELVNRKNALFRRQAELMYIKRSQRLEEEQCDLETKIRILMSKPESQRNEEDELLEKDLMAQYIDVVDQRNCIVDSIEMDRRREMEEDHSVQEQLEIKNGDLPIAAEIKEKSDHSKAKKEKKKKKKKEKEDKKLQENGTDSGKGTLKKKKWLAKLSHNS